MPLKVQPADVDETPREGEDPVLYAQRLAAAKAEAVAASSPGHWVLAADTVVDVDGLILGKPRDAAEARSMLIRLAGRSHRVTTAFAIRGPGDGHDRAVTTEVIMRSVGEAEVDDYVAAGEWRGKAGGYAVQGMAAAMVTEVRGSVTNVIGLPLAEVLVALRGVGAVEPSYTDGVPA